MSSEGTRQEPYVIQVDTASKENLTSHLLVCCTEDTHLTTVLDVSVLQHLRAQADECFAD